VIPPFDDQGRLPPGRHDAEWYEVNLRLGTTPYRRELLAGLKRALDALKAAGCRQAFLDGSFVTAKEAPGDFDACWSIDGVDPTLLDPVLLTFDNLRAAQKIKYGGELFPAEAEADEYGRTFLEFFQIDKETGEEKGIIVLDLGRLP